MTHKHENLLRSMPSTLLASSGIQVVKLGPLPYQSGTHFYNCFVFGLQVPARGYLVLLQPSAELLNIGHSYFSPRIHLLQGAFISLIKKSLPRRFYLYSSPSVLISLRIMRHMQIHLIIISTTPIIITYVHEMDPHLLPVL